MVEKPIKLLLFFCFFFSFTISETIPSTINYKGSKFSEHYSGPQTFQINFEKAFEYIHIKVTSDTEGTNPIVLMSSEDQTCKNQRRLMTLQPYNAINVFFRQAKVPKSVEYVCIEFPQKDSDNIGYTLEIIDEKICQLTLGEQYSYYVDEKSTRMQFQFSYDSSSLLRRLSTVFNINFWVKGQSNPKVNPIESLESKEFDYGTLFSGEYTGGKDYIVSIEAEEGDYITVGSLIIDDGVSKELKVNDLEIMGLLKKDENEICFPIKTDSNLNGKLLRINGNAFTKDVITYFKHGGIMNTTSSKMIENGLIEDILLYNEYNSEEYSYCLRHIFKESDRIDIIYSLQLTSNSINNLNQFIYPPQLPGVIYSHYLLKGEVAVFLGMKPKEGAKEINFNMKAIKGFPDMLFDKCLTFPNCVYNSEQFNYAANPEHSNRMTVYSYYIDEEKEEFKDFNPLTSFQPILIVKCVNGTYDEELMKSEFCQFETSIFTNKDRMNIIEGETYSQYLLNGEEDLYTINIENQQSLKKVYLDLIVFSGDVDFIIESTDSEAHKYYISNKIFYSIHVGPNSKKIDFRVKAYKNSFYLVQHQLVKDMYNYEEAKDLNRIESGVNYIQSIFYGEDASFKKNILFKNLKFDTKSPFLVSFYSQNCRYVVTRSIAPSNIEAIPINDNYGQIIIDEKDPFFTSDKYLFTIDIISDDKSNYDNKLCVFYLTGLEISNSDTGYERSISVSDGIPQYYIFTKQYPFMKYSFHLSDVENPVIINFNLIDKAPYIVKVYFGYVEKVQKTIYRNENILLLPSMLKKECVIEDEVCTINFSIELENKDDDIQRKLETTIYQVKGTPIYLEKNVVKQDLLFGNERKLYYLDIGKEDTGDITVDYKRGSGYIYVKVVNKTNSTEFDPNADWRGIYEFPKNKEESLKYETYLKKIIITPEDTQFCDNGCYLLISIVNSYYRKNNENDENIKYLPYRFTITPRITKAEYLFKTESVPIIKMKVNDFVVGNLYPTDEKIYEFYQVTLPFESEYIYIDWQSDKSTVLINVGDKRPTNKEYDFRFNSTGYDTTFKITKTQIINKLETNITSLRNVILTIGIWNCEVDTLYTSVYAFKISMPPSYYMSETIESFEIHHIRADQKIQCDPFDYSDGVYACIFAVVFDESDTNSSLVVYPRSQSENVHISYMGEFLDAERIERNDLLYIASEMSSLNDNTEFSSENSPFMYVDTIDRSKSLFFAVYSEKLTKIEVLSSTYQLYDKQTLIPNPSTAQIFALGSKTIELNFETTKDLLINIVSLSGEGAFYWNTTEEDFMQYYLNGFEDRLTLTSATSVEKNKLSHLIARSQTFVENNKIPGFVFYMTFYPRNNDYNIDQLKVGRATEFNYREPKFPLNFYTRLTDKEVSVSLTFYNYYMDKGEKLSYDNNLYQIWGKILTEEDAMNARFDEYYRPSNDKYSVKGSVDGPFATLFFSSEDIEKFGIVEEEHPTLFFSVDIDNQTQHNFKEIDVEVNLLREQIDNEIEVVTSENVYYHGKLANDKNNSSPTFIYKIRTGKTNSYMRIEFSANSDYVKYGVTKDAKEKTNFKELKDFEEKDLKGRKIITFQIPTLDEPYLYLIIYSDKQIEPKLSNFIFKYMNSDNKFDFVDFTMESEELEVQTSENNGGKTYTISFYPIEHHDVSYYIKGIYHNDIIEGEKKDTIAISESNGYNLLIENPEFDGESKISVSLEDVKEEIDYIKVLAKINFDTNKQFLLYEPYTINGDEGNYTGDYELIPPSKELITLKYDSEKQIYKGNAKNANKIQTYKINLDKTSDYINIQLSSNENLKNKVMSISSKENAKDNRIQIIQLGNEKSANIWIKKEQLENNILYATVECDIKENEKCNYLMDFSGYDYILKNSSDFNYQYSVDEKNKEMNFKIMNDKSSGNNNILTIIATGEKEIELILKDESGKEYKNDKNRNFKEGSVIIEKLSGNSDYFDLTVIAEERDFITIGSKIITGEKSDIIELEPNGYEISGYLERNILEKECYLIPEKNSESQYSYIVARLNKSAEISFKDIDYNDIEKTNEIVTKGYYTYIYDYNDNQNKRKYICIGLPNEEQFYSNSLIYYLQLTQPTNKVGRTNTYSPQIGGIIYPRIIKKGSYAFFNGINLDGLLHPIIYNMITNEGVLKMYMYKCTNYPFCEIDFNNENSENDGTNKTELIRINELDHLSTWQNMEEEKYNSPIDLVQYIMIVKCEELADSETDFCQFQTSIYGTNDTVYLLERESFSQYIFKEKKSQYIIDLSEEKAVSKVHIDVLVVSGDVDINLSGNDNQSISPHKYYLSNKIFYSISIKDNSEIKNIVVKVEGKVDTFYIIEYKLVRDETELTNDIYSGINNLVPFSRDNDQNKKVINIHNNKALPSEFYFANFHSLNCKFEIIRNDNNNRMESFVNYAQNTITSDEIKDKDTISYNINIKEVDSSKYDSNMCMLYVSSLEIAQDKYSEYQKEILVSEGITQRVVFTRLKKIKYIYPVPDKEKNIAIFFKVINPANYSYIITFNHKIGKQNYFYSNNIDFISKELITEGCWEFDLCNIVLTIETKSNEEYTPDLEISIRQIDNNPYYLSKGIVKQDFVPASTWLNLFTTLGKDDNGYINVNFARGSGLIYAKIVSINGEADEDPDWRQYKFPKTQEGTLKYDFYNKKILFTKEDTSICDDGCYLLISLQSSAIGNLDEQYRFHLFSITVELIPDGELKKNGPIIQIEPEEYIIGSFNDSERIKNKDMYEFYQINIPYDADRVEFDWQSDSSKLLINIGEERPTMDNSDFKFENRYDTIFEISKDKIKEKLKSSNTIANAFITIGVYTEDMETNYGTAYSFRVHFSKNLNIYKINSDQKALCKPDSIENNQYRCLFMIAYGELDFIYDLMIYSQSQSLSGVTYMYGDFITKEIYDQLDIDTLKDKIPKEETARYNTKKDNLDFIFLTFSDYESHLFISVISDKPDIIEFITSFKTFDRELSPNPSSVQLFAVNNYLNMKLKFKTTKPLIISLVSLYGTSKIYFEDEPESSYIIRGRDDRISLAIPYNSGKEAILIVEDMNKVNNKKDEENINLMTTIEDEKVEKPKIAFYLEYYLRSNDLNLDEIYLGKTSEIVYKSSDLPLYYYAKLNNIENNLNIFFNFHDLELSDNKQDFLKIKPDEYSFKAYIITQNDIYKLKTGEISAINSPQISGIYDPALQTGQILLTSEDLKAYKDTLNPTLYISLEKQNTEKEFKKIRLELTAVQKDSDIPTTEKIYQFGRLLNSDDINSYKLNVDNTTGDMRIQFAANNKYIDFTINEKKGEKSNSTTLNPKEWETKVDTGKVFVTFKKPDKEFIYLNVFFNRNKNKNDDSNNLNNYVFKYINAESRKNFYEYPFLNKNGSIEVKIENKLQNNKNITNLNAKFNKIDKGNVNIVYSLKVVKNKKFGEGELNDTIALSNSNSIVSQVQNQNSDKISIDINDIGDDNTYVQVIAQIRDGPIIEYVAYNPFYLNGYIPPKPDNPTPDNKDPNKNDGDDDDDDNKLIWIVASVGGAIFIILIVLIVIVLIYSRKTKDLLQQVNQISFAESGKKDNGGGDVLLDEQNELK